MKALWVTNVPVSDSPIWPGAGSVFGGWIDAGFRAIHARGDLEMTVCSPGDSSKLISGRGPMAEHFQFSHTRSLPHLSAIFEQVDPDIVHVHGTEFPHSAEAVTAARSKGIPSVISIQGFMAAYADAFYHDIPLLARYGFTARDLFRRENAFLKRRDFVERGRSERRALEVTDAVIGRTEWDRACVSSVNARVPYFHCGETLRQTFYGPRWDIAKARRNSIFISQGNYPIKGAHKVISALPIVLEEYPDTHLHIAGHDPTHEHSKWPSLRRSGYGAFLNRLIQRLGVANHVTFLGLLDEADMLRQHLASHVFVLPSSIENSPNSLAEAMILGVPSLAAFVGGVPSMVRSGEAITYPTSDHRMLAYQIKRLFGDEELCRGLSEASRRRATAEHAPARNAEQLARIYEGVATSG